VPRTNPEVTIIDLLENALDGELTPAAVGKLDLLQIAELAESVQDFYESWSRLSSPRAASAFTSAAGSQATPNTKAHGTFCMPGFSTPMRS
jgi:hypothetical protein